jgi:hypothetical protein
MHLRLDFVNTELCLLSAFLVLGFASAQAQSSVTVKVETYHGAVVSGARVVARLLGPVKRGSKTREVLQVIDVPEKETGRYTADRLSMGEYQLFACDDGMNYEPQISEVFQLGDNDTKKIPTLVLRDEPQLEDPPPFSGLPKGAKICVIHKATGCKVTKTIDGHGNITIRGIWEHYGFEPQACKDK